ncbi:unnamed protein product [Adineta steineri]|uniref:Calcineurin-like phosphoesterase domain-containing protein n=1 Tax=Adineta steineri TaxID=433720 RepID=A0A819PX15_9BILA|nr:unnamed protein product [Adineta steineri]CAF4015759.1 unnamed protein product [Adineta steineri]
MPGHSNGQNSMPISENDDTVDNVNDASSDVAATSQSEIEFNSVSSGNNSDHYDTAADESSREETISPEDEAVKIVCISDTHNGHNNDEFNEKIRQMQGDILIHAGDFGEQGTDEERKSIFEWLRSLENFKYKVYISGNMDGIGLNKSKRVSASQASKKKFLSDDKVIYLQNNSCNVLGINIYGCPYTPRFFGGFQYDRLSEESKELWGMIPENCDILVSHGPPSGILDTNSKGKR